MCLSSRSRNSEYGLRCSPHIHTVLFNNKGVRLSEFDFFVVERLLENSGVPISANELYRLASHYGFKKDLAEIEDCLSRLDFTLRHGLNAPISIFRSKKGFQLRFRMLRTSRHCTTRAQRTNKATQSS